VSRLVKVGLTQGQFDALVSFTYNLGARSLSTSTLLRKLNAGDYAGAADEFLRWNKAGGKVLNGLTRRREAERAVPVVISALVKRYWLQLLVVALIGVLAFFVNHYRDNAITYKDQRDKATVGQYIRGDHQQRDHHDEPHPRHLTGYPECKERTGTERRNAHCLHQTGGRRSVR
jgi:hypothetical protein